MIILLAAIAVPAVIGEFLDAVIISMLIILSAIVGFVQEYRSERTVETLKQLTSPTSIVIRGGNEANITSRGLMIGISITLWLTSFAIFWFTLSNDTSLSIVDDPEISKARTMVFAYVILFELFLAYSIRSYQNNP